jgi:hypothetical protein
MTLITTHRNLLSILTISLQFGQLLAIVSVVKITLFICIIASLSNFCSYLIFSSSKRFFSNISFLSKLLTIRSSSLINFYAFLLAKTASILDLFDKLILRNYFNKFSFCLTCSAIGLPHLFACLHITGSSSIGFFLFRFPMRKIFVSVAFD